MREIKFRGWNRKEKEMEFDTNHYSLDHEIMQYTGIKDDEANEIYEGDIVKMTCSFIPSPLASLRSDVTGEVRMLEGGWVIDSGTELRSLWNETNNLQIVGNIHEQHLSKEEERT